MAAHEEQISQNRRRLFKALSTAPVVATLSPGAALANSSAVQCLANTTDPANFHETGTMCSTGDPDCFLYTPIRYWGSSQLAITPNVTLPPDILALTQTQPVVIIVESVADPGLFVTRDDNISGTFISLPAGFSIRRDINTDELVISRDQTTTEPEQTLVTYAPQDGVALKLVDPIDMNGNSTLGNDTVNPPVTADDANVVLPDGYPAPGQPGNLQGLAATCLTSVDPNGTKFTNFVLAKG